MVNKRQQSIFIFRYDGFNASEVYCVKQWENFAWADVSRLWYIVMYSDVISFLTDMRKSRWIPTLMNRSLGKTLINTALILDWWIVMQNFVYGRAPNCMGCYFCISQELHVRQDLLSSVSSDPDGLVPHGLSHSSRDPGCPATPPPRHQRDGSRPVPEGRGGGGDAAGAGTFSPVLVRCVSRRR